MVEAQTADVETALLLVINDNAMSLLRDLA